MKNVCRAFSGFQTDIDRCGAKPVRVGKVRGVDVSYQHNGQTNSNKRPNLRAKGQTWLFLQTNIFVDTIYQVNIA